MLRYFVTRAAVIVRWPCIYVVIYALFLAMDWQNSEICAKIQIKDILHCLKINKSCTGG